MSVVVPAAVQPPVDADFLTPIWMQNESYPASVDRTLINAIWPEAGVIGATAFQVTPRAAGANLSVDVQIGYAIIQGSDAANQGRYAVRLLAVKNRTLAAVPAAGLQRMDLVVLTLWDQAAIGATSNPPWNVQIIKGADVASGPTPPAVPPSSLALANLGPITSSTAQVTSGMIGDRRNIISGLDRLPRGRLGAVNLSGTLPVDSSGGLGPGVSVWNAGGRIHRVTVNAYIYCGASSWVTANLPLYRNGSAVNQWQGRVGTNGGDARIASFTYDDDALAA